MRAATLSLSLVAPQGFDHYAPLSAVELQLPALTGSIFLQAGISPDFGHRVRLEQCFRPRQPLSRSSCWLPPAQSQ